MSEEIEVTAKVNVKLHRTRTDPKEIRRLKRLVKTHSHTNREFNIVSRKYERKKEEAQNLIQEKKDLFVQIGTLEDQTREYKQDIVPKLEKQFEEKREELTKMTGDRDQYKKESEKLEKRLENYIKKTGTLEEKVKNLKKKVEETEQERDLYEEAFEKSTTAGENFAEKIYENNEKILKIY